MWHYRNTVLALTTLAFAATMVARVVISPVLPDVTAAFGVSTGAVGLALTGMWAAYALSQYPGGLLADRYGTRRVVLAAVGLTGVTSALLALAPVFPAFALFSVLLGAAAGLPYSATTTLISETFEDVGRSLGVFAAGGPVAGLVAPLAATAVAALFGWRAAVVLGALVAAPVFLAFSRLIRPTAPQHPDTSLTSRLDVGVVAELLSRSGMAFTVVVAVGGAFAWQATASFLPAFLIDYRGFSQGTAGALFSLYFLVHGVTQPVTGWLSDRYGRDRAAAFTMGVATAGYALLVLAPRSPLAVAAVPLVGLGMSWGAPVQSRFMDRLGAAERAMGFGLVRTVYMVLGSLGSVVTGTLADAFGWASAFGLLAALAAFEMVVLLANAALDPGY